MVTVFFSIMNQMDFHLVHNRMESCSNDHMSSNLKENGILVFSVYVSLFLSRNLTGFPPLQLAASAAWPSAGKGNASAPTAPAASAPAVSMQLLSVPAVSIIICNVSCKCASCE